MRKLLALVMVLSATGQVLGQAGPDTNFVLSTGVGGDDDRTNSTNWAGATPGLVPAIVNSAGISDTARIGPAVAAEAYILRVGWEPLNAFNATGALTVQGSLTTGQSVRLGEGPGSNGTLTVEADAVVDNRSSADPGEFWVGSEGTAELFVSGPINSVSMDISNNSVSPELMNATVHVLPGGVIDLTGRLNVGWFGGNASLIV